MPAQMLPMTRVKPADGGGMEGQTVLAEPFPVWRLCAFFEKLTIVWVNTSQLFCLIQGTGQLFLPPANRLRNYYYYENEVQHQHQQQEDPFLLPGDYSLPVVVVHVVRGGRGGAVVEPRSHTRDPRQQRWTAPREWQ
jgi:hypothetical protein